MTAVLVSAAAAAAQTQGWVGLEHLSGSGTDEALASTTYADTAGQYVFVTGYVSEPSGATRLAIYRYDTNAPAGDQDPDAFYFFPPIGITAVGPTRGVAITVDQSDPLLTGGTVYVTGYTRFNELGGVDTHLNYVTIKLNKNLAPVAGTAGWLAPPGSIFPDGIRIYADPEGKNDKGVDLALDTDHDNGGPYLYVTGSSEKVCGGEAAPIKNDVVTIKYAPDGSYSGTWPAIGTQPVGRRRWTRNSCGNDIPVGIAVILITDQGETATAGFWTFVGGTSEGGTSDFFAIAYDADAVGALGADNFNEWQNFHDGGFADTATAQAASEWQGALPGNGVFVTGYSVRPDDGGSLAGGAFGASAAALPNTDYAAVAFNLVTGVPLWTQGGQPPARYWHVVADDYSRASALGYVGDNVTGFPILTLTGDVKSAGTGYDTGTIIFDAGSGTARCSRVFGVAANSDDRAYAITPWDDKAYIAGSGAGDALVFRIDYGLGVCPLPWWATYPVPPSGGFEVGRAITFDANGFFTSGQAPNGAFGQDFWTVRHTFP